jgi:hypothetical protein
MISVTFFRMAECWGRLSIVGRRFLATGRNAEEERIWWDEEEPESETKRGAGAGDSTSAA